MNHAELLLLVDQELFPIPSKDAKLKGSLE